MCNQLLEGSLHKTSQGFLSIKRPKYLRTNMFYRHWLIVCPRNSLWLNNAVISNAFEWNIVMSEWLIRTCFSRFPIFAPQFLNNVLCGFYNRVHIIKENMKRVRSSHVFFSFHKWLQCFRTQWTYWLVRRDKLCTSFITYGGEVTLY